MKRFLLPVILIVFALALMLGGVEVRVKRADFFGKTVFYPFTHSIRAIKTNAELRAELGQLRTQLAESTLHNLRLKNTIKESQTLQAISFDTGGISFDIAEVIGYSGQFQQRNLMVNKGMGAGIKPESPVVSSRGIVGKVMTVSGGHSIVMPFSNPQFQITVMDMASSVQGILQSDLTGNLSMNMIKLGSEISTGDTIVTSNLSTLFPKGYPVGTISRIRESQDYLFITAEISPFTQIENLEHVFILRRSAK